jgi:hypothetical protein
MDKLGPAAGIGMLAGALLGWFFVCYCFFRIYRRLNVASAWMAFVPIIQVWPLIKAADKPWWWLLLLLVPLVGVVITVMIYMSLMENLGKNRMLGLLVLLPPVLLVYIIVLAFSSSGPKAGTAMPEDEDMPDLSGEPPIPDLDFDLDEEEPRSPVEDDFDIPEDIEEPKSAEPEDIEEPANQKLAEDPDLDDFLTDNAFLEDEEEEANKE